MIFDLNGMFENLYKFTYLNGIYTCSKRHCAAATLAHQMAIFDFFIAHLYFTQFDPDPALDLDTHILGTHQKRLVKIFSLSPCSQRLLVLELSAGGAYPLPQHEVGSEIPQQLQGYKL